MSIFKLKQFDIEHDRSSMKVGTDAVLLGCLADITNGRILEIGCGCGIISLLLAQRYPQNQITAIDIHQGSIEDTIRNFAQSPWSDRLSCQCVALQTFAENTEEQFDFIISNPPFFSNSQLPPDPARLHARHTVGLSYDDLILFSETLLNENGTLVVIIPTLEYPTLQKTLEKSSLNVFKKIDIFARDPKTSKRLILYLSRHAVHEQNDVFYLHEDGKDYSDAYYRLTADYLLNQ